MSPGDQAAGFLTANESFVASDEAIDDATGAPHRRYETSAGAGDLATHASFRLNELTLHFTFVLPVDADG